MYVLSTFYRLLLVSTILLFFHCFQILFYFLSEFWDFKSHADRAMFWLYEKMNIFRQADCSYTYFSYIIVLFTAINSGYRFYLTKWRIVYNKLRQTKVMSMIILFLFLDESNIMDSSFAYFCTGTFAMFVSLFAYIYLEKLVSIIYITSHRRSYYSVGGV